MARLLVELPHEARVPPDLIERAKALQNLYIPARHPNGHPEGAPFDHYGVLQSASAIEHANAIRAFDPAQMA